MPKAQRAAVGRGGGGGDGEQRSGKEVMRRGGPAREWRERESRPCIVKCIEAHPDGSILARIDFARGLISSITESKPGLGTYCTCSHRPRGREGRREGGKWRERTREESAGLVHRMRAPGGVFRRNVPDLTGESAKLSDSQISTPLTSDIAFDRSLRRADRRNRQLIIHRFPR